jgi:FtsP/CotA-like multicopper oxidase with cupredoxin domain
MNSTASHRAGRSGTIKRRLAAGLAALVLCAATGTPTFARAPGQASPPAITPSSRMVTAADRAAAAARAAANKAAGKDGAKPAAVPGGTPDYFGTTPNYANSPLPTVSGSVVSGGIRKFVDSLAGLGSANVNDLGQYMPVALADQTTYPGSDYYEIGLVQFREKLSTDLPATLLRGYVQLETPVNAGTSKHIALTNTLVDGTVVAAVNAAGHQVFGYDNPQYLGPSIVAQHNVPVRVKFSNLLPTGSGGDLFIPLDTTDMGAGGGPVDLSGNPCDPMMSATCAPYSQNRATLHLHGGTTPWISDGTPDQWTTPAGQVTQYPKGVSVQNVPDMPDPGPGSLTFFYTNQESARLLFYHDHSYGITRLNVYAGEAAPYLIQDATEQALVAAGTLPTDQIPLVIQDKTFVPGPTQLAAEDPTWDTTKYGGLGNLWFPHVYMPNQNPTDAQGVNAMGRWDYGPWFWPPYSGLTNGPVANPLAGSTPEEGPVNPGTPNPSIVPESFMDTMLVNGTVYPYLQVGQKAYRFRILNASNDRTLNLQLYYATSNATMWNPDGSLNDANAGEVTMTAAISGTPATAGYPPDITDGRVGGVPDVRTQGPAMIQIGTESGFLPNPVTLSDSPIGYTYNRRDVTVLNVSTKSLMLGPAERADIIVDFSQVPDGSKLILYNDSPAPVPAFDPRYDYYTGDPDQTSTGGAPTTLPGYGPDTRTIMQIQVTSAKGTAPLFNSGALTTALPLAFAQSQHQPVVPEAAFNAAYGTTSANTYVRIQDTKITFTPYGTTTPLTMDLQPKAIQELFETQYGRMNATLGVELPNTTGINQTTVPLGYAEPYTEELLPSDLGTPVGTLGDGTQIWKITHNGVDTHSIHFHLFDVQLINRVGWDGMVKPPDPNEVGWKDTVRMNPLEDAIVALRPVIPQTPFGVPDSIRRIDVTRPATAMIATFDPLTAQAITVPNSLVNYGWEYVWHCHLLGHEENDMMRPIVFRVPSTLPSAPALTIAPSGNNVALTWTDGTPVTSVYGPSSNWGNPAAEIGFRIMRATITSGTIGAYSVVATALANSTTFLDTSVAAGNQYSYQVVAFNAAGNSSSNLARFPVATYLTVGGLTTPRTAGSTGSIRVTAVDSYGVRVTSYAGTVHFTSTDLQASLPPNYTFTVGDAGTHVFSANVILKTAGTWSVTAADTLTAITKGVQTGIVVTPAPVSTLVVSGLTTPRTAGSTGSIRVTATDPYGNRNTGYLGTVHFTSTDPAASLPGNYTFTAGDAGTHVFVANVILKTVGTWSVTATDTVTASIRGTQAGVVVTPAAAATLVVSGLTTPRTAGSTGSVRVTAVDTYGNTVTSYVGTIHFTSTDGAATLPANYKFVAGDAGTHLFAGIVLKTVGTRSVTATDTVTASITGTQAGIVVQPAAAATLVVSGLTTPRTAGSTGSIRVTAVDAYGNTVTGYVGTIHFTSTDTAASLPANYKFTAGDAGTHVFAANVILKTVGTWSVTATDTVTASIKGTQAGVVVTPAAVSVLVVSGLTTPRTAGSTGSIRVTAVDAYGNRVTSYLGTVHFTSTDPAASLPPSYKFTAGDAGTHVFAANVILKTIGTWSVTATDTVTASIKGTQTGVVVN